LAKTTRKKPARTPTVRASWTRIEIWLAKNSPQRAELLGKPGDLKELRDIERKLKIKFPKTFVDSHLIHSGGKNKCEVFPYGNLGGYCLLMPKEILRDWESMEYVKSFGDFDNSVVKPAKGVANIWWSEKWIPFASNLFGDMLCFDFGPTKGGLKGQVIQFIHDGPKRTVLGKNFGDFLAKAARRTEKGMLVDPEDEEETAAKFSAYFKRYYGSGAKKNAKTKK
jgi:cell wall assembly regulator SMI1